ncbi:MAG: mechanosensitive ion channel [Candidatus Caldarchaeum sp.]
MLSPEAAAYLWPLTLLGLSIVSRVFLGPLSDLFSPRLGGFVRLGGVFSSAAGLSLLLFEAYKFEQTLGLLLTVSCCVLLAVGYKPLKMVVVGDALKAGGVLREGDYIVLGKQTARVSEVGATHTVLTTSDLRKVLVPNDVFLAEKHVNMTRSGAGVLTVRIKVNGRQISMADAKLVLMKTGTDLAKGEMAPNRAPEVRVEKIEGDFATLKLTIYLLNPAKAESLASHIMERVYLKLAEVAREAVI